MEVLSLWVPGIPRPRPSAYAMPIRGGNGRGAMVYYKYEEYFKDKVNGHRVRKPWDAGRWRDAIKAAAERAWTIYTPCSRNVIKGPGRMKEPLDGCILAAVDFYFQREQYMLDDEFKYGRDAFRYNKKPDADNLWKLAADAITESGVWVDDSRVHPEINRWYSAVGGDPGMRVVLECDEQPATLFDRAMAPGILKEKK